MKKKLLLLVTALAALFVMVACSGSSSDGTYSHTESGMTMTVTLKGEKVTGTLSTSQLGLEMEIPVTGTLSPKDKTISIAYDDSKASELIKAAIETIGGADALSIEGTYSINKAKNLEITVNGSTVELERQK